MAAERQEGAGQGGREATGRRRRSSPLLERERIVAAALALVDREGLKALSMRRLGAELGVDPMAVYHYLPSKQALLDAIVEAVMGAIPLECEAGAPVFERILAAARAYRDALLAHPQALPIVLAHGPATAAALRPVEILVALLREAGLGPAEAMAGMNAIASMARGAAAMEAEHPQGPQYLPAALHAAPAGEFPCLRESLAALAGAEPCGDRGFEYGLRALTAGLLQGRG